VIEFLIKLGAPPVLILVSKLLDIFFLPTPGTWLPGLGEGLRYTAALAGTAIAHKTLGPKISTILGPALVMIASAFGYQYLVQNPPSVQGLIWRTILMPVAFIFVYFFMGFLVSEIVAAVWPREKH
jgi:hypothetical protein